MSDLIAIVGRPNVGKSALFNRIAGKRIAIVHDEPGVTRDRVSAEAEWRGRSFTLVDTGGIGLLKGEKARDEIALAALKQVELAIEAAQIIIMVVNVKEGVVALDYEVASRLRASGKTILLAVNKVDHRGLDNQMADFAELGFDRMFPVSAIHGHGVSALMDGALALLPLAAKPAGDSQDLSPGESCEPIQGPLKIAIVGRPNVGKSSMINALTRAERVVVTPIAGTTRDSVDVPFDVETDGVRQRYILIDTAGLRKERRIDDSVEFYSLKRTEASISRCDIAVLMLDAESGILEQDKKIAGKIVEEQKACIVVINKWDLVEADLRRGRKEQSERLRGSGGKGRGSSTSLADFGRWAQENLFFIDYSPVLFTSAKTGFHLERLLEAIRFVAAQLRQTIPTALLNRTLRSAIERQQPVSNRGHFLKFFYATQVKQAPPTFLLFLNRDELLSEAYAKYLTKEMRRAFGFEGCPIVLVAKARPKTVESIKKTKRARTRPSGLPKRSRVNS